MLKEVHNFITSAILEIRAYMNFFCFDNNIFSFYISLMIYFLIDLENCSEDIVVEIISQIIKLDFREIS